MADTAILGLSAFQFIILIFLISGCFHYMWLVWDSREEGFKVETESDKSRTAWFENDELFDDFYSSVYDSLTQLGGRYPQEIALIINQWKKTSELDTMDVLDCGCGTGIATVLFSKMGVNSVTGLDNSESMLRRARSVTLSGSTLNREQRESIRFLKGDMNQQATFSGGEFSHATLLFFTVYYSNDPSGLFNNLFHWIRPGGQLAIEVVNKFKFDPLLEAASPFTGTTIQKYVKKRATKSKVVFDKFSYEAEFDLKDPIAEFREVFRFPDKSVRRQRHTLQMKDINDFVHIAQVAGWNYNGFIDLMSAGFEYAYVLMFTHP
jgi:SAM-dependent methyltransferase